MTETKAQRKHYLDNLRWLFIVVLIPFHVGMAWNCWGEGNYIHFYGNRILSSGIIFIAAWYMPILFAVAGISARYSMKRRTTGQFILERVKKLLIPLLIGMVTVVAAMTYYADRFHNGYEGNFFEHYKVFFTKITTMTGYDGGWTPAHLWFLLYLFLISLFALCVIKIVSYIAKKKLFPAFSCAKINEAGLILLGIVPALSAYFLSFEGKSVIMYLALFLIGYYVLFEEQVEGKLKKYWVFHGLLSIAGDIVNVYLFIWAKKTNGMINTVSMYSAMWFGILAILGFSSMHFNQCNKVTRYLTRNSFYIYIMHFIWLIVFQYYMRDIISNTAVFYILTVVFAYPATFLSVELLTRMIQKVKTGMSLKKDV